MAGYHLKEIPRGTLGEFSKIQEEFNEFIDAHEQKCKLMELLELSDLVGCVKLFYAAQDLSNIWEDFITGCYTLPNMPSCTFTELCEAFTLVENIPNNYVNLNHFLTLVHYYVGQYNLSIFDLLTMSQITERVFINGFRV